MTALDPGSGRASPVSRGYVAECHACAAPFDALNAMWCVCIVKERSLVCPSCEQCFCRADVEYKRKFWTDAPEALWGRKQKQTRERWTLAENPLPDEVRRPLVLVVDDDRDVRTVATHLIQAWGFGCIHAADGRDALDLAHIYKPEVVLTDALMPKMDGRELCRTIKSDPALTGTKVIIMSSVYTSSRFRREAVSQFKADEFVSKPVDAKLLHALVYRDTELAPPLRESVALETPLEEDAWVPASPAPEPIEPLLGVVSNEVSVAPAIALREDVMEIEEEEEPEHREPADREPARAGLTAAQLIYLRAIGFDGEIAARAKRMPEISALDLIALQAAEVPVAFIEAVHGAAEGAITASELTMLYGSGCDPESIRSLRDLGFTIPDVGGVCAAEISLADVWELVEVCGRRLTAAEVVRMHAAGVEISWVRAIRAHGYDFGAEEWLRLWSVGVTSEFVEAVTPALAQRCSATEILRLWLAGVDIALLREISP